MSVCSNFGTRREVRRCPDSFGQIGLWLDEVVESGGQASSKGLTKHVAEYAMSIS